jgi:hypothetical protein
MGAFFGRMAMNSKAAALAGVAIGLVIGILGERMMSGRCEELAVQSLDHLGALAENMIARERASIVELYPSGARGGGGAESATPLPPEVRERIDELEALLTQRIEITRQRIGESTLAIEKLVQKGDGGSVGESIDLVALTPVDLSGGRLGDRRRAPNSDGAIALPEDLSLERGERIRLYTRRSFGEDSEAGIRVVELHGPRRIWEGDPGERDRIWIADRRGQVLLDLDYLVP